MRLFNVKPDFKILPLSLGVQLYRLLGPILLNRPLLRAVYLFFIYSYPLFAEPELKNRAIKLLLVLDVTVFKQSDLKLALGHLDELGETILQVQVQAWRDLHESLALLSSQKNYFLGVFLPTLLGSLTQVDDARSKTNVRSCILALFVKSDH